MLESGRHVVLVHVEHDGDPCPGEPRDGSVQRVQIRSIPPVVDGPGSINPRTGRFEVRPAESEPNGVRIPAGQRPGTRSERAAASPSHTRPGVRGRSPLHRSARAHPPRAVAPASPPRPRPALGASTASPRSAARAQPGRRRDPSLHTPQPAPPPLGTPWTSGRQSSRYVYTRACAGPRGPSRARCPAGTRTPRRVGGVILTVAKLDKARWWVVRPAQNRKPVTYRCPLCGYYLHAMTSHMLIAPEGDASRRRHAHGVRPGRTRGGGAAGGRVADDTAAHVESTAAGCDT